MAEDPLRLRNHLEAPVGRIHGLRAAEQQNAALAQRKMERREHPRLRFRPQVDQQIAARNQVEVRKWRICQNILDGEDDARAQLRRYPVAVVLFHEEAGEAVGRNLCRDGLRIEALAGAGDRVRVDIGGKNLKLDVALRLTDGFAEQHGERVRLLAGAAAGNPDAQGLVGRLPIDEIGNDVLRQEVESLSIAKEVGDIDQQVAGEKIAFAGVAVENLQVALHAIGFDRGHGHAPLDPALQGAGLVQPEIVPGLHPQKVDDARQPLRWPVLRARSVPGPRQAHPPVVGDQRIGDPGHRQHQVDGAGRDGAQRHAVEAGLVGLLGDDQAAAFFHGLQPERAIGPGTRKDHRDGPRAVFLRQRMQQEVERQAGTMRGPRPRQAQGAVANRQIGSRRDDVEMVGRQRRSVGGLAHGHRRVRGEQVDHHALVGRVEMLDQDEGHAVAGGHPVHQLAAGLQATGRGADADNREVAGAARPAGRGRRSPARSGSRRTGLWRTGMWHGHGFLGAGDQRELRSIR